MYSMEYNKFFHKCHDNRCKIWIFLQIIKKLKLCTIFFANSVLKLPMHFCSIISNISINTHQEELLLGFCTLYAYI